MILKIQKPNPGIKEAVQYNEKKMDGAEGPRPSDTDEELSAIENGHVLVTRNVPEGRTLIEEFEMTRMQYLRKRRSGPAVKNSTFHMSVNPSEDDRKLTDDEAITFIDDVMQALGYKNQPYRIYKHTDIQRHHYHVVSCRETRLGKKINDSFDWLKLRRFLRNVSEKYGFEVILSDYEKEIEEKKKTKSEKKETETALTPPVPMTKADNGTDEKKAERKKAVKEKDTKKITFVPSYGRDKETPVTTQMKNIMDDALAWHFSTFEQLQLLLMKRYSLRLEAEESLYHERLVMSGMKLSKKEDSFKIVTPFLSEKDLETDYLSRIRTKLENEKMPARKEQKARIEKLTQAAAGVAKTYDEFLSIMEKKGVWVMLSWKKDDSGPFGITYIDRATKCIWKGSETAVNLPWLEETAKSKEWTITRTPIVDAGQKRNMMPSRRPDIKTKTTNPMPASRQGGSQSGLPVFRAGHQQGSNADAKNNRDSVLDKKNNRDKPKEYIGERND